MGGSGGVVADGEICEGHWRHVSRSGGWPGIKSARHMWLDASQPWQSHSSKFKVRNKTARSHPPPPPRGGEHDQVHGHRHDNKNSDKKRALILLIFLLLLIVCIVVIAVL